MLPSTVMTSETPAAHTSTERDARYGAIVTGGGEMLIYDREQPDAWIQSDHALEITAIA